MALIICPECGKEISDKATVCIHCGFPIEHKNNSNTSKIYTYICDNDLCLSNPFKEFNEYKGKTIKCPDCGGQLEYYETEIVDSNTDLVVERLQNETNNTTSTNTSKCPTCGSTDVQKITGLERGISIATLGLFSKKINKSFKCNHCGYTW